MSFDGIEKKIDYVLVYHDSKDEADKNARIIFQKNLQQSGLELEIEESVKNPKTFFVKIHVPWEICLIYAERIKLKMPLKSKETRHSTQSISQNMEEAFRKFFRFPCISQHSFIMYNDLIAKVTKKNCFTAQFRRDKLEYFDIVDEKTFFSSAERSRIAHRILSESFFGTKDKNIGIDRLLLKGTYSDAFPLHEGDFSDHYEEITDEENVRSFLYAKWAYWKRWYKPQPLGLVKYYLGDKIGLYFAWLGFYNVALIIPSIVGFFCFLYSTIAVWTFPPTQEICDENYPNYTGDFTMCPLCDKQCTFWKLRTSCSAARVTFIFDNESTIFFAVFMSIWATMFLEFWKRRQFYISYQWDLISYDEKRDLVRPEYEARVLRERFNPINQKMEPYLGPIHRYSRSTFSIVTVLFWIAVVIAAVFSIIIFRLAINTVFEATVDKESLKNVGNVASPSVLTTITASMLSVLVILTLNWIYVKVALWLTYLELPRTQLLFEDSFALKMFCFKFVNFYSYLFYVAFFKPSFSGYPKSYNYLFDQWRWEECDVAGCMYELTLQLFVIMFAKQFWNNILEILYPWYINVFYYKKYNNIFGISINTKCSRWEQDYDLYPHSELDLFYEYLELVIQFGFTTLFVVAFPLAPILALLNNIIELRLDAYKFICKYRRPLTQKATDIGIWYYLLDFLGTLAVVTNAFTIAVTSEAIPKLVYYYRRAPELYGISTLHGYINDSLSVFNVSDFKAKNLPDNPNPFSGEIVTECRYKDYRNPPNIEPKYQYTEQYWRTFAARLSFIIVMEHVVFFLKRFLDYLIPDRSRKLKDKIKREHYLVQQMLIEAEKEKFRKELEKELAPLVPEFNEIPIYENSTGESSYRHSFAD